jgi:hypothetical protein
VTFGAVSFERVVCRDCISAHDIFSTRNYFQVSRINAITDAAQMVKSHAIRYGSDHKFVRKPVSKYDNWIDVKGSVPIPKTATSPNPTRSQLRSGLWDGTILIYLRPKSFLWRSSHVNMRFLRSHRCCISIASCLRREAFSNLLLSLIASFVTANTTRQF